jgi:DNA-binding MarR family transcriptional regulator
MDQPLTYVLHQLVSLMDTAADRLLKEHFGISYGRFHFLLILSKSPRTTQHGLTTKLGHSDAAISRMANVLQKEHLLTISQDPSHARRNNLVLTAAGTKLVYDAGDMLETTFGDLLQMSRIDLDAYYQMTVKISKALQKY